MLGRRICSQVLIYFFYLLFFFLLNYWIFFLRCILLKDSSDHRHYKCLKKAYLEVKLAHEKKTSSTLAPTTESSSAKAFQAIKCISRWIIISRYLFFTTKVFTLPGIMTLKRKLKRIREGRGGENCDDVDDMTTD